MNTQSLAIIEKNIEKAQKIMALVNQGKILGEESVGWASMTLKIHSNLIELIERQKAEVEAQAKVKAEVEAQAKVKEEESKALQAQVQPMVQELLEGRFSSISEILQAAKDHMSNVNLCGGEDSLYCGMWLMPTRYARAIIHAYR